MKVLVLFYSTYGHVFRLAQAVCAGIRDVPGVEAVIMRVPETLPAEVLEALEAGDAQRALADVPIATLEDLAECDAIIFGTPLRYGEVANQMRQFLDGTTALWVQRKLAGKPGSLFTNSASLNDDEETTIQRFHTTLLQQGMVVVGLPFSFQIQARLEAFTVGAPLGSTIPSSGKGEGEVSDHAIASARCQGRHVAQIAKKLAA